MQEIRMLRAMRRVLETGLRKLLTGHEGGNAEYRQGVSFGLPRQRSTLPGWAGIAAGYRTRRLTTGLKGRSLKDRSEPRHRLETLRTQKMRVR